MIWVILDEWGWHLVYPMCHPHSTEITQINYLHTNHQNIIWIIFHWLIIHLLFKVSLQVYYDGWNIPHNMTGDESFSPKLAKTFKLAEIGAYSSSWFGPCRCLSHGHRLIYGMLPYDRDRKEHLPTWSLPPSCPLASGCAHSLWFPRFSTSRIAAFQFFDHATATAPLMFWWAAPLLLFCCILLISRRNFLLCARECHSNPNSSQHCPRVSSDCIAFNRVGSLVFLIAAFSAFSPCCST